MAMRAGQSQNRSALFKSSLCTGFLVWLLVFFVYVATLCPAIYLIDGGELTTVCYTLGIAHPTGYPLYTILGRIFTLIPIGSIALRANLLSAFFGSIALLIFFMVAKTILHDSYLALIPASLVAFSHTLWSTSLSAEVYPLTAFFIAVMLLLFTSSRTSRHIYLYFFVAGLSFCNHMIVFALFIPISVYMLTRHRLNMKQWMFCILLFVTGLSIYAYLPIRAAGQPLLNWGNPFNLERFIWHITGRQYRVWMFSSPLNEVISNLKNGLLHLAYEWLYIFLPLVFIGMRRVFRTNRAVFWTLVFIVTLNILYSINYSIPDIESYFLPTVFVFGLFTANGLLSLQKCLRRGLVLVSAVLPIVFHFSQSTMQSNYAGYDFGKNFLNSLPENSIFLTDYWDIYSTSIYIRHVEQLRQDVSIIDKELLRRSWYFLYLKREYPTTYQRSEPEIRAYLRLLDDFEHDRLKDPNEIQKRYVEMIESFIKKNQGERKCYMLLLTSPLDETQILPDKLRIPYGLVYELSDTISYQFFDYGRIAIRRPRFTSDERLMVNMGIYKKVVGDRIGYLSRIGKTEEARSIEVWLRSNF